MNQRFLLLFAGVFVILTAGFVFADSYDLVSSGQTAEAGDIVSVLSFNVTNTTSTTGTNLTTVTLVLTGNASATDLVSVNISDGTSDYSNGSIVGTTITIDASNANTQTIGNLTINVTLNSSVAYGTSFGLNITSVGTQANATANPTSNSSSVFVTESTAPTVSAVQEVDSTYTTIRTDFTSGKCSDSGAAASGILSCVLSSSGGTVDGKEITGLSCGTSYTLTVTATDNAGNTGSAVKEISTDVCAGGGSAYSAPAPKPQTNKNVVSELLPGVASVVKNFNSEIGVKEIQIEVNNKVQGIEIVMTKYDGESAQITKTKSGKVYQYFEVDADSLKNNIQKATLVARVDKSWVSESGLGKEDIAVSKFDEFSSVWNELPTVYADEDDDYYYYDAELDSFSIFAVGEKSLEESTGPKTSSSGNGESLGSKKSLFVIVAVVVLGIIAALAYRSKGHRSTQNSSSEKSASKSSKKRRK